MASTSHKNRSSLEEALLPLARRLISSGVTSAEFETAVSRAFVAAAMEVARLKNGKVNQSKVAIMTGYSRTEIRKVLQGKREDSLERSFGARRLLDGWSRDPEFSSRTGSRKPLPVSGTYGSFQSLCKKYSGDIPSKAALDELVRIGFVEKRRGKIIESRQLKSNSETHSNDAFQSLCRGLKSLVGDGAVEYQSEFMPLVADELEFAFGKEFIAAIAEDRARQSMRAFMNGLAASLDPLKKQESKVDKKSASRLRIRAVLEREIKSRQSR